MNDYVSTNTDIDYILFEPELDVLDRQYLLLEVEFEPNSKTYFYLHLGKDGLKT